MRADIPLHRNHSMHLARFLLLALLAACSFAADDIGLSDQPATAAVSGQAITPSSVTTSTPVTTFTSGTLTPFIQSIGTTGNSAVAAARYVASAANAPAFILGKSRGATTGTPGVITTGDTLGTLSWQGDDGTNFIQSASIVAQASGAISTGIVPGRLRFFTNRLSDGAAQQASAIDLNQITLFGAATIDGQSLFTTGTVTPRVQVIGTSTTTQAGSASLATYTNNTGASSLYFAKSRSGTIGTMTLVTTADTLGTLDWQGADGTNFVSAARIVVSATGTPAAGVMPGNLVLQTATTAGTLTTAITVDNAQSVTHNATTDATSKTSGGAVFNGGVGVAKNVIAGEGMACGVASTATAAGTTTLTSASAGVQIFTGATTQNVQLPAANLFGSGISVQYTVINRSSGTVTALRAGSDTINAAATSFAVVTVTATTFFSDGVSAWYTK